MLATFLLLSPIFHFLRDVWIRGQRAAIASWKGTLSVSMFSFSIRNHYIVIVSNHGKEMCPRTRIGESKGYGFYVPPCNSTVRLQGSLNSSFKEKVQLLTQKRLQAAQPFFKLYS